MKYYGPFWCALTHSIQHAIEDPELEAFPALLHGGNLKPLIGPWVIPEGSI